MKQQGILALVLVLVAVCSTPASATARSSKSLRSGRGTLAEAETESGASQADARDDLESDSEDRGELLDRLSKAESLTGIERSALQAQQRVLLALAQQQEALESRVHRLEASEQTEASDIVMEKGTVSSSIQKTSILRQQQLQKKRPHVYEVAAEKAARKVDPSHATKNPAQPEGAGFFIAIKESEKEFWARYNKAFWEKMIGISFYLAQIFFVAFLYMQFCKHSAAPKLPESQVRTEEFQYGLFDASDLLRDNQMCICAICCPWIRWADTVSAPNINFLAFVPALFITALLSSAGTVTFGCSIPILLLIVVICRQRIRDAYGLPSGTCGIVLGDCALWICCPCCAIVQEARQVEYVDIPMQDMASYGYLPDKESSR